MYDQTFEALGLKEEEAGVYLALLDSGPATCTDISKILDLKRPTVYGYLERLRMAGLVIESQRGGVKIFVPEAAEKIRLLYKRKIEDLREKEKALDALIPELNKRKGRSLSKPRMQFYEGRHEMETALQDFLSYPGITVRTFWPFNAVIDATSEEFFDYITKQRILLDISTKGIWPHNHRIDTRRHPSMSADPKLKREVRIAPPGSDVDMAYRIYANKVLFSSSQNESFCFIIESNELVDLMTMQHEVLWKASTPMISEPSDAQLFIKSTETF